MTAKISIFLKIHAQCLIKIKGEIKLLQNISDDQPISKTQPKEKLIQFTDCSGQE